MLEFYGRLSESCLKIKFRREKKALLIICFTMLLICIIAAIIFYLLKSPGFKEFLYISIIIIIFAFVLLSTKHFKSIIMYTPYKIVVDTKNNLITMTAEGFQNLKPKVRNFSKIKKIIDYGDWYCICFKFDSTDIIPCQKNSITLGTIEQFETLFKDKIVKNEKAFKD